ncbi:MAG TPA: hypothetical protein P5539_10820 [Mesotoga sp.]|nr:hypothetical protein [Mesotoga sp.]
MKLAFETALLQKVNDVCLAFAGSTIDDANKYLTIQTCKNKVYMYVSDGFGIFSLVRTTNVEFQDLVMRIELSVFKDIARNCQDKLVQIDLDNDSAKIESGSRTFVAPAFKDNSKPITFDQFMDTSSGIEASELSKLIDNASFVASYGYENADIIMFKRQSSIVCLGNGNGLSYFEMKGEFDENTVVTFPYTTSRHFFKALEFIPKDAKLQLYSFQGNTLFAGSSYLFMFPRIPDERYRGIVELSGEYISLVKDTPVATLDYSSLKDTAAMLSKFENNHRTQTMLRFDKYGFLNFDSVADKTVKVSDRMKVENLPANFQPAKVNCRSLNSFLARTRKSKIGLAMTKYGPLFTTLSRDFAIIA